MVDEGKYKKKKYESKLMMNLFVVKAFVSNVLE